MNIFLDKEPVSLNLSLEYINFSDTFLFDEHILILE